MRLALILAIAVLPTVMLFAANYLYCLVVARRRRAQQRAAIKRWSQQPRTEISIPRGAANTARVDRLAPLFIDYSDLEEER